MQHPTSNLIVSKPYDNLHGKNLVLQRSLNSALARFLLAPITSSGLGAFADVTCHLAQCVREYSCDASSRHASFVAASARDSRVTERNQCSRSLAPARCHSADVMFRETRVGRGWHIYFGRVRISLNDVSGSSTTALHKRLFTKPVLPPKLQYVLFDYFS